MSANGQLYHPMNMPNADRLQTIEQETVYLLTSTAEELWDTAATVASSGQSTYDDWEAARASLEPRARPAPEGARPQAGAVQTRPHTTCGSIAATCRAQAKQIRRPGRTPPGLFF